MEKKIQSDREKITAMVEACETAHSFLCSYNGEAKNEINDCLFRIAQIIAKSCDDITCQYNESGAYSKCSVNFTKHEGEDTVFLNAEYFGDDVWSYSISYCKGFYAKYNVDFDLDEETVNPIPLKERKEFLKFYKEKLKGEINENHI